MCKTDLFIIALLPGMLEMASHRMLGAKHVEADPGTVPTFVDEM